MFWMHASSQTDALPRRLPTYTTQHAELQTDFAYRCMMRSAQTNVPKTYTAAPKKHYLATTDNPIIGLGLRQDSPCGVCHRCHRALHGVA